MVRSDRKLNVVLERNGVGCDQASFRRALERLAVGA
jgi:hypothetical protein